MDGRLHGPEFTTTHWSVVLAAGQSNSPEAADALERLCRVISDINERAGGLPASNLGVVYSGSSDDVALNAGVLRYEATPAAAQFARKFDPSGFLPHTKVFALQTARDGAVPVAANLDAYRNLLSPEDRERYAQRLTDSAAQSAYAPGVLGQALAELASWIAGGPAPSP